MKYYMDLFLLKGNFSDEFLLFRLILSAFIPSAFTFGILHLTEEGSVIQINFCLLISLAIAIFSLWRSTSKAAKFAERLNNLKLFRQIYHLFQSINILATIILIWPSAVALLLGKDLNNAVKISGNLVLLGVIVFTYTFTLSAYLILKSAYDPSLIKKAE